MSGYDNTIGIRHTINGQTVMSWYGHMWDGHLYVATGDRVTAGQHFADVGSLIACAICWAIGQANGNWQLASNGRTRVVITLGGVLALTISGIVWGFVTNSSKPHMASQGKLGVIVSCTATVIGGALVVLINFFDTPAIPSDPNPGTGYSCRRPTRSASASSKPPIFAIKVSEARRRIVHQQAVVCLHRLNCGRGSVGSFPLVEGACNGNPAIFGGTVRLR